MNGLRTDAELAEQFGITTKKLHELRKRNAWPCVKLGRFDVRFTDEQVEQIVAMHSETPTRREQQRVTVPGQTARSAARRRAS